MHRLGSVIVYNKVHVSLLSHVQQTHKPLTLCFSANQDVGPLIVLCYEKKGKDKKKKKREIQWVTCSGVVRVMWYVPKCCPVPVYAISSSCSFSYSITFRLNSIKSVRIQALGRVMGLGLGVLCDYPQVYFGSFGSSIFALEKCISVCPFRVGFSTDLHWLRSKLVHPCWLVMCNYSCLLHIFMIAMIAVAYRNKQSLWQLLMWQEHLWLILNG